MRENTGDQHKACALTFKRELQPKCVRGALIKATKNQALKLSL